VKRNYLKTQREGEKKGRGTLEMRLKMAHKNRGRFSVFTPYSLENPEMARYNLPGARSQEPGARNGIIIL
jgi:hypothetical protein